MSGQDRRPAFALRRLPRDASRSKTTNPRRNSAYYRCAPGSRRADPPRRSRARVLTCPVRRPPGTGPRLRADLRYPDPALALPLRCRRRRGALLLPAGPVPPNGAVLPLSVPPPRFVSYSVLQEGFDFTPAHRRPALALCRTLLGRRDRRPGWSAERLQHCPDFRVGDMVGRPQPHYRFRREPVAAREPLEGGLRLGRRAGPTARLQGRTRVRRALPRGTRHLARCRSLPGVRLDRERLLGFVRAAQHRPLRPRLLPDHTLRHGLLRHRDLAAPGRCVLVLLRTTRQVRAHRSQGE